jgi:hypothetical protein
MPHIVLIASFAAAAGAAIGPNEDVLPEYPLRAEIEFTPNNIYFGDLVFVTVVLKNGGDKTIIVQRDLPLEGLTFELLPDEVAWALRQESASPASNELASLLAKYSAVYAWCTACEMDVEETGFYLCGYTIEVGCSLRPGESREILFRPVWVPLPERDSTLVSRQFKQCIDSVNRVCQYGWNASLSLSHIFQCPLGEPPVDEKGRPNRVALEGIMPMSLGEHGYAFPQFRNLHAGMIVIHSRPDEELALLREWFLEIPETIHPERWYLCGVFVHPFYARGSPYDLTAEMRQNGELRRGAMLRERSDEYEMFFQKMKTRSSEIEERIARTKELERRLLHPISKKLPPEARGPDSTLSPMMKEFIVLRGHLVEVRYAKCEADRLKAFDAMLQWIATTGHRELWKKYLDKVVLNPRSHPDVLPPESFDKFRARCNEQDE